jgi:putative PIN family toxin of toxin-antitoxin system
MNARAPVRAVIDTNVLLDFWVFEDPRAAPLRLAVESGEVGALRSGPSVDEFSDVLGRPVFGVSNERRCTILRHWDRLAVPIDRVHAAPFACNDPHDQKFLDLALTAGADWLISKDKALLKLARRARREGLQIVDPAGAVSLIIRRA